MHALVYVLTILIGVSAPILFAVWLRRCFRVSWFLFAVGTLTFLGSQIVHLPLNNLLSNWGLLPQGELSGAVLTRSALILGLSAGLCEELARVLGYSLLKKYRKVEDGLMLGLGHGGMEAMIILGIITSGTVAQLFALRGQDLGSLGLTAAQMDNIRGLLSMFDQSPLLGFMPLLERLIAMALHVTLSLLVLRAFQKKNAVWVAAAILYHALVDFGAVMLRYSTENSLVIEASFLAITLPGLAWAFWTYRKDALQRMEKVGTEWGLFWQSLRKELLQLWRTKMVIVIIGVFALFGIASPLLAFFMPQIFGSIQGAEMFKDLIPQPALKDALDQYIKNISQFGFLIAILVGMGKVSGEKERGMTEMILHKPLPRWAFILSKFVAQALIYLPAFLMAELFAYGYSVYLFEPFSLAAFSWINLLLLIWLLVFAALTTLASTVARSSGAAAGLSLAGAVLLLLSGQIPTYGTLSPQALMTWAASLTGDLAFNLQNGNFAALGCALLFIILALIWAVGLFEQQEI